MKMALGVAFLVGAIAAYHDWKLGFFILTWTAVTCLILSNLTVSD